jgi:hypothetical protein
VFERRGNGLEKLTHSIARLILNKSQSGGAQKVRDFLVRGAFPWRVEAFI